VCDAHLRVECTPHDVFKELAAFHEFKHHEERLLHDIRIRTGKYSRARARFESNLGSFKGALQQHNIWVDKRAANVSLAVHFETVLLGHAGHIDDLPGE
jgi:hypothetical protein